MTTKLDPPRPRAGEILRPELLARLGGSPPHRLTLVCAPAGWGKTTLLGAWVDAERPHRAIAWVTLEDADNDPTRLWTYVGEALCRALPELDPRLLDLLQAPGAEPEDAFLPELVNAIAALGRPVALVLDDYHAIRGQAAHRQVRFLYEHLPAPFHLVLGTRTDPPLRVARLRAAGELGELRAPELALSRAEAGEVLRGVLGDLLSPTDVERLQRRTEGWPAGLQLAALGLRGRDDPAALVDSFTGSDRHVVDYLASEVLDQLPEELRTFLLETAVLERLAAPLCAALLGRAEAGVLLDEAERLNLFLSPIDQARAWFRYHALFREALLHQLDRRSPGRARELHARAAAWHEEAGTAREAIRHRLAAGELERAAELVATSWTGYFNEGRLATVQAWLDALGPDLVEGDPRLVAARAWVALDGGRLHEAGRLVGDGVRELDAVGTAARLTYLFKAGRVGEAHREAAVVVGSIDDGSFAATVARLVLGVTAYWLGDDETARAALEHAAETADDAGNLLGRTYAVSYLALLAATRGELADARRLVADAGSGEDARGAAEHFVAHAAESARAVLLAADGDGPGACAAAGRALALARRGAGRVELAAALAGLARATAALGRAGDARRLAAEARALAVACPDPGRPSRVLGASARAAVDAGALSDRELAVLRLLATRLTQREIGAELHVSLNTVKTHVRHILRKLDAATRAEAVGVARQRGLM